MPTGSWLYYIYFFLITKEGWDRIVGQEFLWSGAWWEGHKGRIQVFGRLAVGGQKVEVCVRWWRADTTAPSVTSNISQYIW